MKNKEEKGICKECDEEFQYIRKTLSKKKFCSKECYIKWMKIRGGRW